MTKETIMQDKKSVMNRYVVSLNFMIFHNMTVFAGPVIEGLVYESLEKFWILGCMRFMAFPAIQREGIDAEMALAEGGFLIVVAFATQTLNRCCNQGEFIGEMGFMAGLTVLQVIGGMDEEPRILRYQRISLFLPREFKRSGLSLAGARVHF